MERFYKLVEPNLVKLLVGNRVDLEDQRVVDYKEAKRLADLNKMTYFETSANLNKTGMSW